MAGIPVIGDEIPSGRTKDKNIGYIAEYLTNIGVDLKQVRVVPDEEMDIIAALDASGSGTPRSLPPAVSDLPTTTSPPKRRQGVRRRHRPSPRGGGAVSRTLERGDGFE